MERTDMDRAFDEYTGYNTNEELVRHHVNYLRAQDSNSRGLPGLDFLSIMTGIGVSITSQVLKGKKRRAELKKVRTTPLDIRLNNYTDSPIIISSVNSPCSHSLDSILVLPSSQSTITVHFPYTLQNDFMLESAYVGLAFGSGENYTHFNLEFQADFRFSNHSDKNPQGNFRVIKIEVSDSESKKWGNYFKPEDDSSEPKDYSSELKLYKMRSLANMMKQITIVTASSLDFESPLNLTFYDSVRG